MKAGISANELMFKLRSRGIYSVEKIKNCIFEQNGQLTIIENDEDNIGSSKKLKKQVIIVSMISF